VILDISSLINRLRDDHDIGQNIPPYMVNPTSSAAQSRLAVGMDVALSPASVQQCKAGQKERRGGAQHLQVRRKGTWSH
jgi:hypothetical protein